MGPPTSGIPGFTAGRKGRAPSRETSHASICPGHELFVGHSWGEGGGTRHDSRLARGARRPEGVAWTRLVLRALSAAPGNARRFAPLGAGVVFRRAVRRMSCDRKPTGAGDACSAGEGRGSAPAPGSWAPGAGRRGGGAFSRGATGAHRAVLDHPDRGAFAAAGDRGAPPPFFRTMKELTLVGYYTSEIGATRELRHAPVPGRFEGCVPLDRIGRAWAV